MLLKACGGFVEKSQTQGLQIPSEVLWCVFRELSTFYVLLFLFIQCKHDGFWLVSTGKTKVVEGVQDLFRNANNFKKHHTNQS